tara:strand:- start:332 stop:709 length:378 start_codon:yes stop_codon:yes gene_type:complete
MGKDKLKDDWSFPFSEKTDPLSRMPPRKVETLSSLYVDGDGMPTQPLKQPSSPSAPKADTPLSPSGGRGRVGRSKDKTASALNKPPPPPSKVKKPGDSKGKPRTFTSQQRRDILRKAQDIRGNKK